MKLKYITALIGIAVTTVLTAEIWRESTFEDFRDGSFGDGGANTYVSAGGRIQNINRWDANGDGYIDLLYANSHAYAVQVDLSIYWGNGKDYSIKNHSYVPGWGPETVTTADLDKDGAVDLVLANRQNGTTEDMDSFVYYGGLDNSDSPTKPNQWAFYPFRKKSVLPIDGSNNCAVGDINGDGNLDIVFARNGAARLFWGKDRGEFDPNDHTDLPVSDTTDVAIADLNEDNWPDIIFSGMKDLSVVLWGGPEGISSDRQLELPTREANSVEVADVNNDGRPDLIFANKKGEFSWVYLNRDDSYGQDQRLEFETHSARDSVVADFNNDGLADVFFTTHDVNGFRLADSYLYFGSVDGFSNERRFAFKTMGGWGVSAADLNEDGWIDLLVSNFEEHNTFELPSFIYWNSQDGFDISRRTPLYEHGAKGNAVADFNGDGHLDVLIVSTMTGSRNEYHQNYLYYGNAEGLYNVENRLELTGHMSQWGGMSDMDDDGQVDIVFSNYNEDNLTKWGYQDLYIYWNDYNSFDFYRRTGLPIYMVHGGLVIADLDRDGYLDILSGQENAYPEPGKVESGSLIYWGGPDGWVVSDRSILPVLDCRQPAIADLNGDGHLDLIFGNYSSEKDQTGSIFFTNGTRNTDNWRRQWVEGTEKTGQLQVADLNKDGFLDIVFTRGRKTEDFFFIYYGDKEATYSIDQRVKIDGVWAKTMNVADVNADGWLDLLCANYWHPSEPYGRAGYSDALLGGPDGFRPDRKISLPTNGGDGALVTDFNFDGYNDILWFCHRGDGDVNAIGQYGDHMTDSFLYWGSPTGYNENSRLSLPGRGVHFRKTSDELGHIFNRGFLFDYISSPYRSHAKQPLWINWLAEEPHRSSVRFQVRVASTLEGLKDAAWAGPSGGGTTFTERNSSLKHLPKTEWIQYRAILDTYNGIHSPILTSVEIAFE